MSFPAPPRELEFKEEDIEDAIREPETRGRAIEALAQIRVGREDELPSADALDAAANLLNADRAKFWVQWLKSKDCLPTFVTALRLRGLAIQAWTLDYQHSMFDPKRLSTFLDQVDAFRCKIRVRGAVAGSGILVGPSSALTAWHVIAVAGPDDTVTEHPEIDVVLADGRTIAAVVLQSATSRCGSMEWPPDRGRAPKSDAEVDGRHDVALLRLKEPAGIHLTFAPLASPGVRVSRPGGRRIDFPP